MQKCNEIYWLENTNEIQCKHILNQMYFRNLYKITCCKNLDTHTILFVEKS